MKQHVFSAGTRILIDGKPHVLVKRTPNSEWQIEVEATLGLRIESEMALLRLYEEERLEFSIDDMSLPGGQRARPALPIAALSKRDQVRVPFKAKLIDEMHARQFPGWHAPIVVDGRNTSAFKEALKDVSRELGRPKPVSPASYYAWAATLDVSGDISELRSRYCKGRLQIDARAKAIIVSVMQSIIDQACNSRNESVKPVSMSDIIQEIKDEIGRKNKQIGERNRSAELQGCVDRESLIVAPSSKSRSTYYDYWNKFDAEDRLVVHKGRSMAREMYRGGRGLIRPTAVLDLVEYDETQLPFFVYDEYLRVALGRLWFCWYFEVMSELPIGIYLGFEEVSDLSLMSALRSSCLPKSFLKEEYSLCNDYPVFGIPRQIVFDNPFSQHGNTILGVTTELRNSHRFAPSSVSWFKPHVESSFHTLNAEFLSALPGFVMKGVKKKDYDPAKNGCIGFRALLQLIWKWICVHALGKHTRLGVPRIDVWRESIEKTPPALLTRKCDLDTLFWVIRRGELIRMADHRGVTFERIRYFSHELREFRRAFGSRRQVYVKINPANLEYILVQPAHGLPWIRVQAVDLSYARNRSLLQHQICRKAGKEMFGEDNVSAWERGQAELSALIHDTVRVANSINLMSLAAKAWGLGTQHVTDALDHDGHLTAMAGPFTGQRLAPPMTVLNTFPGSAASGVFIPERPELIFPEAAPPSFDADLSLGGR